MKVYSKVSINASLDKVYSAFTDLKNIDSVISGITKLEILEGSHTIQPGTKWRETRVMFGKEATEEMWVTASEVNKSYTVEAESHGTHYISTYTFRQEGSHTVVDLVFEGKPLSLSAKVMSPLSWLMKGSVKKAFLQDMQELKDSLEVQS